IAGALLAARQEAASSGWNPFHAFQAAPFSDVFLLLLLPFVAALLATRRLPAAQGATQTQKAHHTDPVDQAQPTPVMAGPRQEPRSALGSSTNMTSRRERRAGKPTTCHEMGPEAEGGAPASGQPAGACAGLKPGVVGSTASRSAQTRPGAAG